MQRRTAKLLMLSNRIEEKLHSRETKELLTKNYKS